MRASPVSRSYAGTATSLDVALLRSRGCVTCNFLSASVTCPRCVPCHTTSPSARPRNLAPASSCADSTSNCSMSPRAASFISSSMLACAFSSNSSIGSNAWPLPASHCPIAARSSRLTTFKAVFLALRFPMAVSPLGLGFRSASSILTNSPAETAAFKFQLRVGHRRGALARTQ